MNSCPLAPGLLLTTVKPTDPNSRDSVGEEEELSLLTLCHAPVPLQQYYGGNLSVIPSQESPQIHAISSEPLRLRGKIPSPLWDASHSSLNYAENGGMWKNGVSLRFD